MTLISNRQALYYPFHLCSEGTLKQLLRHFQTIHFRDYMAIQLTPFCGTTAFQDRMGNAYPDLLAAGRLVQGYRTSGPLNEAMEEAVDLDLIDPTWRQWFHQIFREQRRFQRGLFDPSHGMVIGAHLVPGPAALLRLMEKCRAEEPYSVKRVRHLSAKHAGVEDGYRFEYGMALIKTAAAGVWTQWIAQDKQLSVVTDSPGHYALLQRSCERDGNRLANHLLYNDNLCHPDATAGLSPATDLAHPLS